MGTPDELEGFSRPVKISQDFSTGLERHWNPAAAQVRAQLHLPFLEQLLHFLLS